MGLPVLSLAHQDEYQNACGGQGQHHQDHEDQAPGEGSLRFFGALRTAVDAGVGDGIAVFPALVPAVGGGLAGFAAGAGLPVVFTVGEPVAFVAVGVFFGRNDAKAETPLLWPPHAKS